MGRAFPIDADQIFLMDYMFHLQRRGNKKGALRAFLDSLIYI
jgi:hypothetical protein